MRNRTLLIWGRRPQTPAIFRCTARMAGGTINALERRIGLSSDGTRAPTQGPEWLGAPAVAPSNQTRWSLTYCGRKMVLTTGTTFILSAVIALEIGDIARFGNAERLVSYAGLVPAARESAGRKRPGKCPSACNTYLKWAFVEAGNVIATHHHKWPERHVAQLYVRVKHNTKMHGKATVAVGRHLAEAAYWILSKQELYREPKSNRQALSSTHG